MDPGSGVAGSVLDPAAVGDAAPAGGGDADRAGDGARRAGARPRQGRRRYWRLAVVLGLMALLAVVGVVLWATSPYEPDAVDLPNRFASPSRAHPMGTDDLGRDVMIRLVTAGGVSIRAAVQAVFTATVLGATTGLLAGYRGGRVDAFLSRIADALMSLPALLVALTVVAVLGPGLDNAMLAVGVAFSPQLFRVIRSVTIAVRDEEYIAAAEVAGAGPVWVVSRHVLPNVVGFVLVNLALLAGLAILLESGLSFLGLGVQPPTPSWGIMLSNAYSNVHKQSLTMIFPGVTIIVVVLLFNSLADALRDLLLRAEPEDR